MEDLKNKLMALDEEIKELNNKRDELLKDTNLKKCGCCLNYKDKEEFPQKSGSSYCKECFKEYQRARRKAKEEGRIN